MALGLDFTEMSSFYAGHCWPSASLDMNNNHGYARDSCRGERQNTLFCIQNMYNT